MRSGEPACPFCGGSLASASVEGVVPEPAQRLSRAGMLAFATAFLSSACHPSEPPTPPPPAPTVADAGAVMAIYGAPAPPMPTPPPPNPNDMAVPAYGGPPPMPPPAVTPPPAPPPPATPPPRRPGGSISTRYGAPPRPSDEP